MKCGLCPHNCEISEGGFGYCGTRTCIGGEILCKSFGQITSMALDPIEKKPLYHFQPGGMILSVGSFGCNMRCAFCQNHGISQRNNAQAEYVDPERLAALSARTPGNIGVAFTYNEPVLSYEYILSTAPLIHAGGQCVVLVSNGQINPEPLSMLLPHVNAWNIDIKAFSPEFYRKYGGDFETVLRTVETVSRVSHVEVTTLIIPDENDSEDEIAALSEWLFRLSPEIPLHLTRFFPRYKMTDKPPTPADKLQKLIKLAKERLKYVYAGNI